MLVLAWCCVLLGTTQSGNESPTPSVTQARVAEVYIRVQLTMACHMSHKTWLPRQAWHVNLPVAQQLQTIRTATVSSSGRI